MKPSRSKIDHDTVHSYVSEAVTMVTQEKDCLNDAQRQIAYCTASEVVQALLLGMMTSKELNTDELHDICLTGGLIALQTWKNWEFDHERPETDQSDDVASTRQRIQGLPLRWLWRALSFFSRNA